MNQTNEDFFMKQVERNELETYDDTWIRDEPLGAESTFSREGTTEISLWLRGEERGLGNYTPECFGSSMLALHGEYLWFSKI